MKREGLNLSGSCVAMLEEIVWSQHTRFHGGVWREHENVDDREVLGRELSV